MNVIYVDMILIAEHILYRSVFVFLFFVVVQKYCVAGTKAKVLKWRNKGSVLATDKVGVGSSFPSILYIFEKYMSLVTN